MDASLSWLLWKIPSDPTNIIDLVKRRGTDFCDMCCHWQPRSESNQEPRFLAIGTGWISESPTRTLILSSFSSCCCEPIIQSCQSWIQSWSILYPCCVTRKTAKSAEWTSELICPNSFFFFYMRRTQRRYYFVKFDVWINLKSTDLHLTLTSF